MPPPRIYQITTCLILLTIFSPTITPHANAEHVYLPEDIITYDTAYNVTDHYALQWWYLDAVFTNNDSIHLGIMTVGTHGRNGLYLLQIQFYENGTLIHHARRLVPLRCITASPDSLALSLAGKDFLKGYLTDDQNMAVDVNLTVDDISVNLTFIGETKGWKGDTSLGMWGCPLPKAAVHGTITINDEPLTVAGTGYQEHGWDVQRLHRSWFWGKIASDHMNLVFSQNMKNRHEEDVFVTVVNWGEDDYCGIDRANITLTPTLSVWDHGRRIPWEAVFKADQGDIHINVTITVLTVDFSSILVVNYWRLHTRVTGTMSCGDMTDLVDSIQIMEVFHFP